MIRLEVMAPYISLNQKWSAAKIVATADHIVLNRKLLTSFGRNFYCNSFDILFPESDIHQGIEYPMTTFLKLTFWEEILLLVPDYYLPEIVQQFPSTHTYLILSELREVILLEHIYLH